MGRIWIAAESLLKDRNGSRKNQGKSLRSWRNLSERICMVSLHSFLPWSRVSYRWSCPFLSVIDVCVCRCTEVLLLSYSVYIAAHNIFTVSYIAAFNASLVTGSCSDFFTITTRTVKLFEPLFPSVFPLKCLQIYADGTSNLFPLVKQKLNSFRNQFWQ